MWCGAAYRGGVGGWSEGGWGRRYRAFALSASAESLFSAATALDRLHDGARTDYDKELITAQGRVTRCAGRCR